MDIKAIKEAIKGPVPSISTPFTPNGEIDWAAVDRIIEFLLAGGAKSLLLTNGDSLMTVLTDKELEQLVKRVIRDVSGKALVLAGGKAWCTKQTLEYMQFIKETGADVGLPMIPDWAQSAGTDEMFSVIEASVTTKQKSSCRLMRSKADSSLSAAFYIASLQNGQRFRKSDY